MDMHKNDYGSHQTQWNSIGLHRIDSDLIEFAIHLIVNYYPQKVCIFSGKFNKPDKFAMPNKSTKSSRSTTQDGCGNYKKMNK